MCETGFLSWSCSWGGMLLVAGLTTLGVLAAVALVGAALGIRFALRNFKVRFEWVEPTPRPRPAPKRKRPASGTDSTNMGIWFLFLFMGVLAALLIGLLAVVGIK